MLQTRPAKDQKKENLYILKFLQIFVFTLSMHTVIFFSVRLFTEV